MSRSCLDYSVRHDRQRRLHSSRGGSAYSHFRRTHFWHTHAPLVVSRYPSRPVCSSSRSSHTPCVGSLFSRYPSRLAWSRRGLLTRRAWARCSRGIRHAWRGLVVAFSHALRGHVVLAVSVTPGVVSLWASHTPCVGSLFSRYPSRLAWSRRGLLTRLAWARCSRWGWWS
jgi:hypothetical protein